jgi:2-polyprenyl-3-methyl-5-hydroxy-6-metoxy-1,4-benzoquinol methylase
MVSGSSFYIAMRPSRGSNRVPSSHRSSSHSLNASSQRGRSNTQEQSSRSTSVLGSLRERFLANLDDKKIERSRSASPQPKEKKKESRPVAYKKPERRRSLSDIRSDRSFLHLGTMLYFLKKRPQMSNKGFVKDEHDSYLVSGRTFEQISEDFYPKALVPELIERSKQSPDDQKPKVLDVGTGFGKWVEGLREQGVEAYGNDLSDAMPQKPYFKQGAIEQSNYLPGTFDDIFSTYSIFTYATHPGRKIEDTKPALTAITEALKPGGNIHLVPILDKKALSNLIQDFPNLNITDESPNHQYFRITKSK